MADAAHGSPPLSLSVAQVSLAGGRPSNQDAIGVSQAAALACIVLSDGAGGHAGGEIAAAAVVDTLIAAFNKAPACGETELADWIAQAGALVARGQAQQPQLAAMSATVAALVIDRARRVAVWAHLGDTRLYLFRAGALLHQTRDHSLVRQLIDAGLAGPDASRTHARRHVLYAAIGAGDERDTAAQVQPPFALLPGDVFLLCSDGLWEWVDEPEMARTLAQSASMRDWLDALCAAADGNSAKAPAALAGGRDNLTALALRVDAA